MDWNFSDIAPYLFTVLSAVGGAYLAVRIGITEIRKDNAHLKERLEAEIKSKDEIEKQHKEDSRESRGDIKAIFRTLTKIQVDIGKSHGRDEVFNVVREAIVAISDNK